MFQKIYQSESTACLKYVNRYQIMYTHFEKKSGVEIEAGSADKKAYFTNKQY